MMCLTVVSGSRFDCKGYSQEKQEVPTPFVSVPPYSCSDPVADVLDSGSPAR